MDDDELKKRRRKKADTPKLDNGAEREAVVSWMRERVAEIEKDAAERVRLAQTEVQHPNPIYQRLVKHYAAVGFKPALICQLLMMKPSVLKTFYEEELTIGPAQINLKMAETLMTIGFDPMHPQAATVAFKWLERMHPEDAFKPPSQRVEVKDDSNQGRVIDSSALTAEQREQVRQIILSAGEQPDDPPAAGESDAQTER